MVSQLSARLGNPVIEWPDVRRRKCKALLTHERNYPKMNSERSPAALIVCMVASRACLAFAGNVEGQDAGKSATAKRPNILWISCEDMYPDLGCCGDSYSLPPNV